MRIAVKEVGKPLRIVETDKKYRSECCQDFVDNDIVQFVYLNDNRTFAFGIDEDGLMKQLPLNFLISTNHPYQPIQFIVGTAVFVRVKYVNPYEEEIWDFEVEDLLDEDLEEIKELLSEERQMFLKVHSRK